MEYFAGLDVSMAETRVCVVTQDGALILEVKVPSTSADIAAALAQVPVCQRIVSTMRKARIALARRLAIIMHAMLRQGTEFKPA